MTTDEINSQTRLLIAEARKLDAEAWKLNAELGNVDAKERMLRRDHDLAIWQVLAIVVGSAAVIFAAGAATMKLIIG